MHKKCLAFVILLAGCADIPSNKTPTPPPTVEFDPANSIVPFPNNLALDPTTHKVNLPMQACESAAQTAVRTNELNVLDGFGTYETRMSFTTTAAPDMGTVTTTGAAPSIVMYKIATGATAENPVGATPVPIGAAVTQSLRFDPADCGNPATIPTVGVVPLVPLDQQSTYVVAVLDTLQTSGTVFSPSGTWALVRQSTEPVTLDADGNVIANTTPLDPADPAQLAELQGLDQVWKVHAPALQFLDATGAIGATADRHHVLVAWTFTTQTTTDTVDPSVPNSPANIAATATPQGKLVGTISLPTQFAGGSTLAFLQAALPTGACNSLPCTAVGDVLTGAFVSPSYQQLGANPLPGGALIPGAWTDPLHPTVQVANESLLFFAFTPTTTGPWPVVVFQHGFTRSKADLFAIGSQLAAAGFASIAMDIQYHGSRAIQTSVDPALGCAGTCSDAGHAACTKACAPFGDPCLNGLGQEVDPTVTPQCYAPILPGDLATQRDALHQTQLDQQQLVRALVACGASSCTSGNNATVFAVDASRILYMGHSLGSILGSVTASVEPHIVASVLNVSGIGIYDILETTPNDEFRCTLVNNLIDEGVVIGQKWDPTNPAGAACLTTDWLMQPGYQQFAGIARWVVDPGDPANYTGKLAPKRFLLQEVVDDQVVPNPTTENEGMLVGQTALTADPIAPGSSTPSAAITTDPMTTKWVKYPLVPSTNNATAGFGNAFSHGSILSPSDTGSSAGHCATSPTTTCTVGTAATDCGAGVPCVTPGDLGTVRIQSDAITFLFENQ